MTICAVVDCARLVHIQKWGLCHPCYDKMRHFGRWPDSPAASHIGQRWRDLLDLIRDPGESHILWTGPTTTGGYGSVRTPDGARTTAHRAALIQCSPMPGEGKFDAAHRPGLGCPRHCINPRHLMWATRAQNLAHKAIDGTAPVGAKNPLAKLTEDQVREIRRRLAGGEKQAVLAAEFGVTQGGVSLIRRRRTWAHLED